MKYAVTLQSLTDFEPLANVSAFYSSSIVFTPHFKSLTLSRVQWQHTLLPNPKVPLLLSRPHMPSTLPAATASTNPSPVFQTSPNHSPPSPCLPNPNPTPKPQNLSSIPGKKPTVSPPPQPHPTHPPPLHLQHPSIPPITASSLTHQQQQHPQRCGITLTRPPQPSPRTITPSEAPAHQRWTSITAWTAGGNKEGQRKRPQRQGG